MDVCLNIKGVEDPPEWTEAFNPWAEPLIDYGDAFPCPASPPSSSQLIELATMIRHERPELENFSVSTLCSLRYESYQKDFGSAKWMLRYPATTAPPAHSPDGNATVNGQDLTTITLSAADAQDALTFTTAEQHPKSECCLAIREQELDSVGESAWKARAEAEEADIMFTRGMSEMDESDEGYSE